MMKVFVVVACFVAVFAEKPGPGIQCPSCTNPYDPMSCTGQTQCHDGHMVCEMHVNTADNNRIDYHCVNSHACTNHETHCRQHTDTSCAYCCNSLDSCKSQRETLFSTKYTTAANAPASSTTSGGMMTTTAATMMTTTAATMTGNMTTAAADASMNTTRWINAATTTTMAPASGRDCAQCGDLATGTECATLELLFPNTVSCPGEKPYCYTTLAQKGSLVKIFRGCAAADTCRTQWWDMTSSNKDCQTVDISVANDLHCTYCCDVDGCNNVIRPNDTSLLMFAP